MAHQKSGVTVARFLVIAPLAILFAVLSWNNARASTGIQAVTPRAAATQAIDTSVASSVPMSGTMPMHGTRQGAMQMQHSCQPDMGQMMSMMAEMHRMVAEMNGMMGGAAKDEVGQTNAMTATVSEEMTSTQAMVHDMGAHVMPFDVGRTTHIFEMTESGGIQEVIAKDPSDSEQIALIQQHLQQEAALFSGGDFSDPLSLHGTDMPGVKDLSAGAAQVKVDYSALPAGAQITFTTADIHLITALHRWFGAQLSDHGADATYR